MSSKRKIAHASHAGSQIDIDCACDAVENAVWISQDFGLLDSRQVADALHPTQNLTLRFIKNDSYASPFVVIQ